MEKVASIIKFDRESDIDTLNDIYDAILTNEALTDEHKNDLLSYMTELIENII